MRTERCQHPEDRIQRGRIFEIDFGEAPVRCGATIGAPFSATSDIAGAVRVNRSRRYGYPVPRGKFPVPLNKQAKTLSRGQIEAILGCLKATRHAPRNTVICLLSVRAGLRAHEIAHLTWAMVSDATDTIGPDLRLEDRASKGRSGRVVPMSKDLREALIVWRTEQNPRSEFIVSTERSSRTSAQAVVNMFFRWYSELGFVGCSSHSGRRTFITNAARKISSVGGSLRDVQMLAGHSDLRITQRYIDGEADAQRRVVELL